jgi:hypothetical protein
MRSAQYDAVKQTFRAVLSPRITNAARLAGSLFQAQHSPEEYDQTILKFPAAGSKRLFQRGPLSHHCSPALLNNSRSALSGESPYPRVLYQNAISD